MGRLIPQAATLMVAVMFLLPDAQAATVYQYTGNTFTSVNENEPPAGTYDTSMRVSISLELEAALGEMAATDISGVITAYTFFDGRNELTQHNSILESAIFTVNSSGTVTNWTATARSPFPDPKADGDIELLITSTLSFDIGAITVCVTVSEAGSCSVTSNDQGSIFFTPGSWSAEVTPVPLPASAWLLATALGMAAGLRRRRIKRT